MRITVTRVLRVCGMKAEPQSSSRHAPQDEFLNEDNHDHRSAEEWEIQAEQHHKSDETGGKPYWAYGCGRTESMFRLALPPHDQPTHAQRHQPDHCEQT